MTPEEYTIKKIDLSKKGQYIWSDWTMKMLKDGLKECKFSDETIKKASKYPIKLIKQICLIHDRQCYLAEYDIIKEPYKKHVKFYKFNPYTECYSDENLIKELEKLYNIKYREKIKKEKQNYMYK